MAKTPLTIEQELEKAAGLKKGKNESRPAFLERLVRAVAEIPEDAWNGLSKGAQNWNNDNSDKLTAGEALDDFPGTVEPTSTRKRPAEAGPATPAAAEPAPPAASRGKRKGGKVAKALKAPKGPKAKSKKAAAAKPAKPAKVKKPRGPSQLDAIRKAIIAKPKITEQQLFDKLKSAFPKIKIGTISTTRANTRATMRLLPEYREAFAA